jgi:DNA-directed RNA polymerase specialized sigma24 family protein
MDGNRAIDPLLEGYLSAPEPESQEELARLLAEQVQPIVESILASRQPRDPDLKQAVLLRLIERLHGLRHRPRRALITNFRGYVAVVTYRVLAEHRRWANRERQRMEPEGDHLVHLPDSRSNTAADLEQRLWLRTLWSEIRQLPPRQRVALILHLRDERGRSAAALLPLTGTASMRQIAAALEIPAQQFAQLWNRLPIDDAAIAGLLGTTRQQVINLRKAARERLGRRMKRTD